MNKKELFFDKAQVYKNNAGVSNKYPFPDLPYLPLVLTNLHLYIFG